jgi:short-subunit dehydrogenase
VSVLVVGASSGLGRALATELALHRHDLLLVASDARDLEAIAADLALRHGIEARVLALDLAREPDPGARIAAAVEGLPSPLSAALLPLGMSRADDDLSLDGARIGSLLAINLHAPLAIVHALAPGLAARHGLVVLFGSIAAVRGRSRNVVYAAAKRALDSLYESLRHRHGAIGLRVQLYRLGFVATNLTWGMQLPLAPAQPSALARQVVRRMGRGSSRRWLPRRYALVAMVLRLLPWPVFRRLRS